MATNTSWLIVVFDDAQRGAWFHDSLFDEEQVRFELKDMGLCPPLEERQRHVRFRLTEPLTPAHYERLNELQALGLFARYSLVDDGKA